MVSHGEGDKHSRVRERGGVVKRHKKKYGSIFRFFTKNCDGRMLDEDTKLRDFFETEVLKLCGSECVGLEQRIISPAAIDRKEEEVLWAKTRRSIEYCIVLATIGLLAFGVRPWLDARERSVPLCYFTKRLIRFGVHDFIVGTNTGWRNARVLLILQCFALAFWFAADVLPPASCRTASHFADLASALGLSSTCIGTTMVVFELLRTTKSAWSQWTTPLDDAARRREKNLAPRRRP